MFHRSFYLFLFSFYAQLCVGQIAPGAASGDRGARRMILRDEGLSQLSAIDLGHPEKNWYVDVPSGRDLQLVGNGRVLLGTGNGFEERDIATGKRVLEVTSFPGTVAARRLRTGNTLLNGINLLEKKGIVLVEVDQAGTVKRSVAFEGFNYVRLVRETANETFLITADDVVFEGDFAGKIIWQATIPAKTKPHAWQAVRINRNRVLVSTGYGRNLLLFDQAGKLVDSITGPPAVNPHFYAGFQVLSNGNYLVTNWQGHGPKFGASGVQLLEYTPSGLLAWSWKQDPGKFSSLQGVILLDGLDLNKTYIENESGKLEAVSHKR